MNENNSIVKMATIALAVAVIGVNGVRAGDQKADTRMKALLKEQLATARELASLPASAFKSGNHGLLEARTAVLNAELDLCETDAQRVSTYEGFITEARKHEEELAELYKLGMTGNPDVLAQKLTRLKAEIALERLRTKR